MPYELIAGCFDIPRFLVRHSAVRSRDSACSRVSRLFRRSQVLIPAFFLDQFDDVPNGFFIVLVYHQGRIRRVDDNDVVDADRSDEMVMGGADDRVGSSYDEVFAGACVALRSQFRTTARVPASCPDRPTQTAPRSPPRCHSVP